MNASGYKNIAIIRLSSLGDIIHTIPAFNLLRKHYPQAHITWFAETAGAKLLNAAAGLDEIIKLDLKAKGFVNKIRAVQDIRSRFRKKFDLVLDFQGLLKSAILCSLLGGYTAGFAKGNLKEPQARFFYNSQAAPFDENQHVILKNIHLIPGASDTGNPPEIEYPLKPIAVSAKLARCLEQNRLEKHGYIILNIGGGWESKLLDVSQNIELINKIKNLTGLPLVILWGNEKEKAAALEISRQTRTPMAEFFDFSELILFIRFSRLIVSADTLALHIADMVKTPSVGIFGPTSPWRNGSLLKESVPVYERLPCSFCYKKKCRNTECIKKISTDKIIESIGKINEQFH